MGSNSRWPIAATRAGLFCIFTQKPKLRAAPNEPVFRDAILKIRALQAEVYGISADSVENLAGFHQAYKLKFPLLANPDAKVIDAYGARIPVLGIAKRWTFILDPNLSVAAIEKDVDPAMDAERVATTLRALQARSLRARPAPFVCQ